MAAETNTKITVRLSDEQLEYVKAKGGVSTYIRYLIAKDMDEDDKSNEAFPSLLDFFTFVG